MSSFQREADSLSSAAVHLEFSQVTAGIADMSPRGGASLSLSSEHGAVVFGGADRGQSHFNDLAIMSRSKRVWRKREAKGDVPTPRSGHGTVCSGKFLFLFGGIDFAEEAAYNDLYVLNLETLEWNYVGEAGTEIAARNSHSLGIVRGNRGTRYLVIFGGASPDLGPLGETFYAVMPDMDVVASSEFFLTWMLLPASPASPEPREMHSTSATPSGSILIAGGRNEKGDVLSDVWELQAADDFESASGAPASPPLQWRQRHDMTLDVPRCAHGAAVVQLQSSSVPQHLCIVGGFTGTAGPGGMPEDVRVMPMPAGDDGDRDGAMLAAAAAWTSIRLPRGIGPRFGLSVCNAAAWVMSAPPPPSPADAEGASLAGAPSDAEAANEDAFNGFLLFGGVNIERDFADVWRCVACPPKDHTAAVTQDV